MGNYFNVGAKIAVSSETPCTTSAAALGFHFLGTGTFMSARTSTAAAKQLITRHGSVGVSRPVSGACQCQRGRGRAKHESPDVAAEAALSQMHQEGIVWP